jgi:hypothetical protein
MEEEEEGEEEGEGEGFGRMFVGFLWCCGVKERG